MDKNRKGYYSTNRLSVGALRVKFMPKSMQTLHKRHPILMPSSSNYVYIAILDNVYDHDELKQQENGNAYAFVPSIQNNRIDAEVIIPIQMLRTCIPSAMTKRFGCTVKIIMPRSNKTKVPCGSRYDCRKSLGALKIITLRPNRDTKEQAVFLLVIYTKKQIKSVYGRRDYILDESGSKEMPLTSNFNYIGKKLDKIKYLKHKLIVLQPLFSEMRMSKKGNPRCGYMNCKKESDKKQQLQ